MEPIKDCRECIYGQDCPTYWHKNKYSLFEELEKYIDEHAEEIVDKWTQARLENMVDIKDIEKSSGFYNLEELEE